MLRALMLATALGFAACAGLPALPPLPAVESRPSQPLGLGTDLACEARELHQCPLGGCQEGQSASTVDAPIYLRVPDGGGNGSFCTANSCEEARFVPIAPPPPGWTAQMITGGRDAMQADLEIARNLRTFTLRGAGGEGVRTWTGECSPAGS